PPPPTPFPYPTLFRSATQQVVPPALQRRPAARALPRLSPADAVRWPRRKGRRPRARPDRVRRRGPVGARAFRSGARETRDEISEDRKSTRLNSSHVAI